MITEKSRWRFLNENKDEELISMTKGLYVDIIMKFISKNKFTNKDIMDILKNKYETVSITDIDTEEKMKALLINLDDVTLEKIMLKLI